jgi:hypothetical protein
MTLPVIETRLFRSRFNEMRVSAISHAGRESISVAATDGDDEMSHHHALAALAKANGWHGKWVGHATSSAMYTWIPVGHPISLEI